MRISTEQKMTKLTLLLVCLEVSNAWPFPSLSDPSQLHHSVISERSSGKPSSFELKDPLIKPNIRVKPVTVICHPTYLEVRVKADLFGNGILVKADDLRLGSEVHPGSACRASPTSADEISVSVALTECGTLYWVTDAALIYTNLLVYSPSPSSDGLIRMEDVVIPIECHYQRRFGVDSLPVLPTWVPYHTTQSASENLAFSLRLMTSDWQQERGSRVYYLGDVINVEASVLMPEMSLRVFIASCVATTTPDTNSVPRYNFIDDNGCLIDGQLTGSQSFFLPRVQPDKLQFQLRAFIFNEAESPEIYITCSLKAYPLNYVSASMSKACSFIDGRWRSAERDDWTCDSCENYDLPDGSNQLKHDWMVSNFDPNQKPNKIPYPPSELTGLPAYSIALEKPVKLSPRMAVDRVSQALQESSASWKSAGVLQKGGSPRAFEQKASVGPLSVYAQKNKVGMLAPPRVREGVKNKKPIPHDSLWTNGFQDKDPEKVTVPDWKWNRQQFDKGLDAELSLPVPTETSLVTSQLPSNLTVTSLERATERSIPKGVSEKLVNMESSVSLSSASKLNFTQLESRTDIMPYSTVQTLAQDSHESMQSGLV